MCRYFWFFNWIAYSFIIVGYHFSVESLGSIRSNSLRWPTSSKLPVHITSTFGESRFDHFHNGLDISGVNVKIYPVSSGSVVWTQRIHRRLNEVPIGGGNSIIIQHDQGFLSGYMHLNKINMISNQEYVVQTDQVIGYSGDTGHSGGAHLHFFFYILQEEQFINPLLHYDRGILNDTLPPRLLYYRSLNRNRLRSNNHKADEDQKNTTVNSALCAKIIDQGTRLYERWGIYSLRIFIDNQQEPAKDIYFDYIQLNQNRWLLNKKYSFEQIYCNDLYLLTEEVLTNQSVSWYAKGYTGPYTKKDVDKVY